MDFPPPDHDPDITGTQVPMEEARALWRRFSIDQWASHSGYSPTVAAAHLLRLTEVGLAQQVGTAWEVRVR